MQASNVFAASTLGEMASSTPMHTRRPFLKELNSPKFHRSIGLPQVFRLHPLFASFVYQAMLLISMHNMG